ncbi:phosphonate ABC transporter substrate-binding protein [Sporosarcina sp. P13]|uniref:PhnD/SsuA/transferrin family substrate-binding protein n=1 Tax=Sporosarcina sp. P13 TaxID=2048263 RepID=UPI000C163AAC|nr:PhnD/SsuA/transferrin family substrate-binding protein [Sporosarcina sp. P13]PIC64142.1 phosphonate ABC transporter substrate-binding protein [Sporosarcina sp. P13]
MKIRNAIFAVLASVTLLMSACSSEKAGAEKIEVDDVIKIVWYPNESGNDMKSSRDEIGQAIEQVTGKSVEHKLTTDYAIAIETMVNNNADLAYMGAQGYVEANKGNEANQPLVVSTGPSGTIDDALYNSWLAVNVDEQDNFKVNGEFTLDTLENKSISFVSNSSTSGFVIPASTIINHFSKKEGFKELNSEDLMEGGPLFSQVLFGNSHQGSAVNVLNRGTDVAAFCDLCVESYVNVVKGVENEVGSIYKVKKDAAEPFNRLAGSEFMLMEVTPVLNGPFVANKNVLGQEDFEKLQNLFSSDEFANNEKIFIPKDSDASGLFYKTEKERFVPVEDAWFNPIRDLVKE